MISQSLSFLVSNQRWDQCPPQGRSWSPSSEGPTNSNEKPSSSLTLPFFPFNSGLMLWWPRMILALHPARPRSPHKNSSWHLSTTDQCKYYNSQCWDYGITCNMEPPLNVFQLATKLVFHIQIAISHRNRRHELLPLITGEKSWRKPTIAIPECSSPQGKAEIIMTNIELYVSSKKHGDISTLPVYVLSWSIHLWCCILEKLKVLKQLL